MTTHIANIRDLGFLIYKRRKQLGWTQSDVASRAGVGRRFVSEIENGKPTAEIAKVFQVMATVSLEINCVEKSADHSPIAHTSIPTMPAIRTIP